MGHDGGRRFIGSLLRLPYHEVSRRLLAGLQAAFPDLRQAHLVVFQHIEHPPGGSRLTSLADAGQITKQSMGELVTDLQSLGYVERIPDPTDGRGKLIRMTEKGWAVHERAFEVVGQIERDWACHYGEQNMAELIRLLDGLIEALALDAEHQGPSGHERGTA
jgi:DNA-binding MarR family transcriptional regulator